MLHQAARRLFASNADTVVGLTRELIDIVGSNWQASAEFAHHELPEAPPGSVARAIQMAMAWAILMHSDSPTMLSRLLAVRGNMIHYYKDAIAMFGRFITTFP